MAYSPRSQKDYNDKCEVVRIKYTPTDMGEYNRLKKYVSATKGITATSYIKELIKADLDNKGISYE